MDTSKDKWQKGALFMMICLTSSQKGLMPTWKAYTETFVNELHYIWSYNNENNVSFMWCCISLIPELEIKMSWEVWASDKNNVLNLFHDRTFNIYKCILFYIIIIPITTSTKDPGTTEDDLVFKAKSGPAMEQYDWFLKAQGPYYFILGWWYPRRPGHRR